VSRWGAHPTTVPRATVDSLLRFPGIAMFPGGEVASKRSFDCPRQGSVEVPVCGLRTIGPSRLPGDPAQLGVPGRRMRLRVSRSADSATRKVTKVAASLMPNSPSTLPRLGYPVLGAMPHILLKAIHGVGRHPQGNSLVTRW
jgi:hypothetical protein